MIGRSLSWLIVSTTRWLKAPPLVLTPIRIVGLSASMVSTRSFDGAASWAYAFCASDRLARDDSSSPSTSNIEMRRRASSWDSPLGCMAAAISLAMPIPAEPAPRNRMRWSLNGASMICSAVVSPASATLAVPWMSSL
jgi:hypothetical protein